MRQVRGLHLGGLGLCGIYGGVHALVDASTAGPLYAALAFHAVPPERRFWLIILYDLLAFAAQAPLGAFLDFVKKPRAFACAGIGLSVLGLFFLQADPLLAVILAGTGNALFHLGCGALSLLATPRDSAGVGLFVAPGALGLGLGTWLGKSGAFPAALMVLLLGLAAAAIAAVRPDAGYERRAELREEVRLSWAALVLLLGSILIRSLIGSTAKYPLEKGLPLLVAMSAAAALGKGLGGLAADRFGWLRSSAIALALSAPLLAFNGGSLWVAAIGMLLFQATMPVTLRATAGIVPRFPGLAFGLNCLALELGALVNASTLKYSFYKPWAQLGTIAAALAALSIALSLFRERGARAVRAL